MKPPLRRQGRRRDTSARARALQAGNVSRNASAAILRETQRSDWQRLLEDQPTCATDGPRAQRCFEERIDQLAAAYFSRLRNQTITTQALLTAAETSRRHCMLIRLNGGHVLIDDSWKPPRASLWYNGRFTDVACLLEYAASRNMSLPKRADLLVCGSDGLSGSDSDALHGVPALTLTHQPRCPSCIPVPMASRGYVSDFASVLHPAKFFATPMGKRLRGGSLKEAGARPWDSKEGRAFFRGRDFTCMPDPSARSKEAHGCEQGKCAAFYHADYEGGPPQTWRDLTATNACFRARLVNGLKRHPDAANLFDVASGRPPYFQTVPESEWERYKLLLVIGNAFGWADRFMASLLKSPATVLVDAGTTEWYYPLLREGVHYLRANSSLTSVQEAVRWGVEHDEQLREIAATGRSYAQSLFTLDHLALYMAAVARGWARVVNGSAVRRSQSLRRASCNRPFPLRPLSGNATHLANGRHGVHRRSDAKLSAAQKAAYYLTLQRQRAAGRA